MSGSSIHAFASATELLAALSAKHVSASELVALYEARIAEHNPQLNVIVERNPDAASAARDVDARRARGEPGLLLGLPITLKESMNVRGLRTTVGMKMWEHQRAERDGAIAARTRVAGAVLLGKTNVPPMLADWQADNAVYGRSNNPWDLTRTPGGSTAGAAAVAAGLTALEYGSDLAGSIRVPASLCGVYGHRPSDTALPRSGQFPFAPPPTNSRVLAVQGPLARSAEDLTLGFDAVAGAEGGEEVAWRLSLPPPRHARLADFRVAVLPLADWVPIDPAIVEVQERLVTRLRAHGCKVGYAQPSSLGDHRESYALYQTLLTIMTSVGVPEEQRQARLAQLRARDARDDLSAAAELRGVESSASDYLSLLVARERIRLAWRAFFQAWDVLLAPAFWQLAFPHLSFKWPPEGAEPLQVEIAGQLVPYGLGSFYPHLATLPGLPATAFPVELSRTGLPVGLQAIGPYLEDRTPIHFTGLVAQQWGGFAAPPGYGQELRLG
jgi:amidase